MKKEVIGWSSSSYETGDFCVNGFFFFGKEFNRDYFISKHGGKNRSVHLSYFDEVDFYFLK